MDNRSQRKLYLDVARVVAIICVVALHANQRVPVDTCLSPIIGQGVPLFLLISGGLVIAKAEEMSIFHFYGKYCKRLIQFFLLIPICSIMTNGLAWFCMGPEVSLQVANNTQSLPELMHVGQSSITEVMLKALKEANGIFPDVSNISNSHTWYLYLIIGFYLLTPFLSKTTKVASTKELIILFLLILVASRGHIPFVKKLASPLDEPYLPFFFGGYLLVSTDVFRKGTMFYRCLMWGGGVLVAVVLLQPIHACEIALLTKLYALVFPLAFLAVIRDYGSVLYSKLIRSLSDCSFGIYLWHFAFLWLMSAFCPMSTCNMWLRFGVFFTASLGGSWLLSMILRKFSCTRWLVS